MNQGDKSLDSTMERVIKDEEYNLSQIGIEEQHIILDESSLGYNEYEEGGESNEVKMNHYIYKLSLFYSGLPTVLCV